MELGREHDVTLAVSLEDEVVPVSVVGDDGVERMTSERDAWLWTRIEAREPCE